MQEETPTIVIEMKTLPQTVRWKRQQLGMSAAALSKKAGFSPSYVSKLEAGTHDPSFSAFAVLARILKFTDQEILFAVKKVGEEATQ